MPPGNPVQFAVVREDPAVERALLGPGAKAALLVASGGCTALTLGSERPDVRLTLVDPNPAQLGLVARKLEALRSHEPGSRGRAEAFGADRDDPASLSGCGNFESLFRGFRAVLDDLVLPYADRRRLLEESGDAAALTGGRYWPVAFELFFSPALLEAMFGPDATQHAAPGSYPGYFRRVVERGLARPDARGNPWLHHVLLGHWLPGAWPAFLERPCPPAPELVQADLASGPHYGAFDLVSLSNVLDWTDERGIAAIAARLCAECRPGTRLVIRQLNNHAPVERRFEPAFAFDRAAGERLAAEDRSLFYERVVVGTRT